MGKAFCRSFAILLCAALIASSIALLAPVRSLPPLVAVDSLFTIAPLEFGNTLTSSVITFPTNMF